MKKRLDQSKNLASAFKKLDDARNALTKAEMDVEMAFRPWSAGRVTNRRKAREELKSVGLL